MARPRGSKRLQEREARLAQGAGKLVGYVRVSTEEQAEEGHSLAGQEQRLVDACARQGFELIWTFSDVASGAKTDRDGLRDAQEAVTRGDAEGIVFGKLDRVTRSMRHGAQLVEWARAEGYTLLSADEGPMVSRGQLVNEALPFFLALAQVERERISRRTKEGLAAARAKGVRLGNTIRTEAADPAAVRAVELLRDGHTYAAIAATLNTEGLLTKRGCAWGTGNTYTLLRRVASELVDARAEGNSGMGDGLEAAVA